MRLTLKVLERLEMRVLVCGNRFTEITMAVEPDTYQRKTLCNGREKLGI